MTTVALVADFAVGGLTTRTYLSQGTSGDVLGVMTGGTDGDVAVSQTTVLAPITTRNATTKIARRGFGVTVGAQLGEFSKTTVSITSGPTVQTFQRNTGDGINYVVLRPVGAGGGVTTLSRAFPVGNLNLVSFPLRPLEPTVEGALGRSATDFLLAGWDPITRVYAAVAPNTPSIGLLEPGKGYFLKFLPNGGPINTTVSLTGITPATDVDYTLHLAYGWNLIGTPFSQDLDITKTSVKYLENDAIVFGAATGADANNAPYGSLIAEQVWGLNQETGAYNPTNSLSADWQGYWVRVYAPQGVTLLIPGPDTPGRSVPTRALVPTASRKPDWAVRLRAIQGKRSSEVTLGAAAGATRSFDPRWDIEAPPRCGARREPCLRERGSDRRWPHGGGLPERPRCQPRNLAPESHHGAVGQCHPRLGRPRNAPQDHATDAFRHGYGGTFSAGKPLRLERGGAGRTDP